MDDPVYKILKDRDIPFTSSGRDYLIKCLNPEHEDSNPSCRVDKLKGIAHCFSCGWKANLFRHFSIITNNTSIRVAKLKEKLNDLKLSAKEIPIPKGAIPFTQSFRGISSLTLKKFGAFYTNDIEELSGRIIFPIKDITGRTVAYIARHMLSDGHPKYLITPKHVSVPLYPIILPSSTNSIILVEGIFDMLNLYDKGLHNTLCSFGTSTLVNNVHTKMLPLKVQGINKVYILYDGDDAGRKAAETLKPIIEQEQFITEIINLPDDIDPGDLTQEDVDSLRKYII